MRNENKHASPFRWMLRQHLFLAVLVFVITFAVFPMQGMMRVLSVGQMMENLTEPLTPASRNYYIKDLTLNFVYSPLNLEVLCLLFGGMGFGAALALFRHLFSRKQAILQAGLPVTRSRDFCLRAGVYAVCSLVPMAVCLAIHPLMVRINGLDDFFNRGEYLTRAAVTLLINLYGFALGALCATVFGTVWSAVLGGLLLAASAEAVLYCWIHMAGWYLETLYVSGAVKGMLRFSPVYSLYKAFYAPGQHSVLPGMLGLLLAGGLAWAAYRRALPENAGHTLNLKRLEPVILGWTAVAGGTVGAIVLSLYLGREITLYAGMILGTAVVWVLTRMLLDQRVRMNLKKWQIPAAAAAVMLLAFLGLRTDLSGYNAWAPAPDSLRAVTVRPSDYSPDEMRFEDPESVEACLDWVSRMREEGLEARRKTPYRGADYADAVVIFQNRNGGTVTRQYSYPENRMPVLQALRILAESSSRQKAEELVTLPKVYCDCALSTFGFYGEEFRDVFGFSPEPEGASRLNAEEVREAYRKDLRARTLETLQEPTLMRIWFSGIDPETGEYIYDSKNYNVKPGDTNTLRMILGADADKWIDYVRGGFARSEEIKVFLVEYIEEDGAMKPVSWQMAESDAEVREWMKQVTCCSDDCFRWPVDPDRLLLVYSLASLREQTEYGTMEIDLEDPEVIRNLPVNENAWSYSYQFMVMPE